MPITGTITGTIAGTATTVSTTQDLNDPIFTVVGTSTGINYSSGPNSVSTSKTPFGRFRMPNTKIKEIEITDNEEIESSLLVFLSRVAYGDTAGLEQLVETIMSIHSEKPLKFTYISEEDSPKWVSYSKYLIVSFGTGEMLIEMEDGVMLIETRVNMELPQTALRFPVSKSMLRTDDYLIASAHIVATVYRERPEFKKIVKKA